jgi:hypothetical protein
MSAWQNLPEQPKKNLTLSPLTVTEKSLNFSAGPFNLFYRSNEATIYNSPFQRQIQLNILFIFEGVTLEDF